MRDNFKKTRSGSVYAVITLFLIASLVTLALSVTNYFTEDIIAEQLEQAAARARTQVLPQAEYFEELPADKWPHEQENIVSVHLAKDGDMNFVGLVIVSKATGYEGPVKTMAGIKPGGFFSGFLVLAESENPGLGKRIREKSFTRQFVERSSWLEFSLSGNDYYNNVDAISGATVSSQAMVESASSALSFAKDIFDYTDIGGRE